ncbi:MAG: histidine--tRNA ligase [Flavobacteriales bacterium]|nr:histidine--tRNA ligase [Flavobacteriales bacterium]
MSQKPRISKGTRDFSPFEVRKREYIFSAMKSVFEKYGFQPIETPSFELSSTLLGKYGEEGDRLIFRILNSGDKMLKADLDALSDKNLGRFSNSLSEKALRYDLTVPFARYVVQHQNDITFPFKRYQIQPVWRADRPQHGRYQEFYQCDIDVVGSPSLLYEIECIQIFDEVLSALKLPAFTIKFNNRKVLNGIAEVTGEKDKLVDMVTAIDKLDKIGEEGVLKELANRGVSDESIKIIKPLFNLNGTNQEVLDEMSAFLSESEVGKEGIEELYFLLKIMSRTSLNKGKLVFDVTLARGLNYYTGAIFEVVADGVKMGSICGGGRYDELTSLFGLKGVSGVGISFGADRIYDVLNELQLFPDTVENSIDYLFLNFGPEEFVRCFELANVLREKGFSCEIYPSASKIQKQMKYANERNAAKVVMIGADELRNEEITIKSMDSGEQLTLSVQEFITTL